MRTTVRSSNGRTETYETKSELRYNSHDVPPGEAIGHQSEDHDLGQFGYKAELEVSLPVLGLQEVLLTGWWI